MAAFVIALAVIVAAAAIEGLATGANAGARLQSLKQPTWSPGFRVWALIGAAYYLTFGFIVFRLIRLGDDGSVLAIGLAVAILLTNAGWNYLFIRQRQLSAAAWLLAPYVAAVILLFVWLLSLDRLAAAALAPYICYMPFLLTWSFAVAGRNP